MVGGLGYAAFRLAPSIEAQLASTLAILAATLVGLSQLHGAAAIGLVLVLAGIVRTPAIACLFYLAGEAGRDRAGEAIAWMAMTSYLGGVLCRPIAAVFADTAGAHAAGLGVVVPLILTLGLVTIALVRRPRATLA